MYLYKMDLLPLYFDIRFKLFTFLILKMNLFGSMK